MKNILSYMLAICLLIVAFCCISTNSSDARLAPTVDTTLSMMNAQSLRSLPLSPVTADAPAPESSDEPISAASAGAYGSSYTSSSAGSYSYGSYNTSSSSGAYGSYDSGSSSGSYGTKEVYAFHRAPVRGFFRNGGFFRRGIIRGRWQAHGPHGGLFSGGCSHCRS